MANAVSICNLALAHLGDEATVASIDPPEGSQQAEHCARFYPIVRSAIMEGYPWRFAARRMELVELADVEPPAQWAYAYTLPVNCLRALAVFLPGAISTDPTLIFDALEQAAIGQPVGEEFTVESLSDNSGVIYTNVEDATLFYIHLVTDPAKYPGLFVIALSRLLASYLAGPVIKGTEGMKVAAAQLKLYNEFDLPNAKMADANARKVSVYDTFTPASIAARA